MHNRFTDKARGVVRLACSAAQRVGVSAVGPDFVLLAIAHYREACVASVILQRLHVSVDAFAEPFDPPQSQVLDATGELSDAFAERACNEARELNHTYVGTEHFLLAIMRSDSSASEYLRNAGVDHQQLRQITIEVLGLPAE